MRIPEPVKVERKVYERDVEARLVKRVKAAGGKCYKWSSKNVRGVFDRIVIMPGPRIYFVELKRDTSCSLSPHQLKFLNEMEEMGLTTDIFNQFGVVVLYGMDSVDTWCDAVLEQSC